MISRFFSLISCIPHFEKHCSKPSVTQEGFSKEEPWALKFSSEELVGQQRAVGGWVGERSEEGIGEILILFPLFAAEPLPLMDLCRRSIRLALGRPRLRDIRSLPLPQSLKNYLQYQ